MKKISMMMMMIMVTTTISSINTTKNLLSEMMYFSMATYNNTNFSLSLMWSYLSKTFLIMVMLVTLLVSLFSEVYMEHYKNKKFNFLMMAFLSSMMILSTSSSLINMMTGWEMLGITSLMLVMFYPNKTSLHNSTMTMFFNRTGDVMMITVLALSLCSTSMNLIHLNSSKTNMETISTMIMMLMLCSMTKSAQMPLSAWLPAAMSAPTPISAMVHSSTLVTAGIFLVQKFNNFIKENDMMQVFSLMSLISFMMGGMLANFEMDLKKMVAFSTMSQISMIMWMSYTTLYKMALTQMMFHAIYKTCLFMASGLKFMYNSEDQSSDSMKESSKNKVAKMTMMMSLFSMSGMLFSMAYYTKHMMMEEMSNTSSLMLNYILIAGSMLTLMYCLKMSKSMMEGTKSKKWMTQKKINTTTLVLINLIMIMPMTKTNMMTKYEWIEFSTPSSSIMTMVMLNTPLFKSKNMTSTKKITMMTKSVVLMKKTTWENIWNKMMWKSKMKEVMFSEKYFNMSNKWKMEKEIKKNSWIKMSMWMMIFTMSTMMM